MDTQNHLILARLAKTPGQWVSMPELCELSGSLNAHTRINDLRKDGGHHIENLQETVPGTRRRKSFYRLIVPESGGDILSPAFIHPLPSLTTSTP